MAAAAAAGSAMKMQTPPRQDWRRLSPRRLSVIPRLTRRHGLNLSVPPEPHGSHTVRAHCFTATGAQGGTRSAFLRRDEGVEEKITPDSTRQQVGGGVGFRRCGIIREWSHGYLVGFFVRDARQRRRRSWRTLSESLRHLFVSLCGGGGNSGLNHHTLHNSNSRSSSGASQRPLAADVGCARRGVGVRAIRGCGGGSAERCGREHVCGFRHFRRFR